MTIENTHMPACGRPWRTREVDAVADVAREHGFALHCDGARIWNAAVALDVAPSELVARADTVMFCLSKGLAAPVGSILCGTRDAIAEARRDRSRLGGGMRQAGVIAAAGIVALETMVDRLRDDHARARAPRGRVGRRGSPDASIPSASRRTSCARRPTVSREILPALAAAGIRAGTIDADTVRFVTHKDVDDADIARTVAVLDDLT